MVESPLLPNQKNGPLLVCKVLKKVPLCQVGEPGERRRARARVGRTEIVRVGWGKKWKFVIPTWRLDVGSVEVLEEFDTK